MNGISSLRNVLAGRFGRPHRGQHARRRARRAARRRRAAGRRTAAPRPRSRQCRAAGSRRRHARRRSRIAAPSAPRDGRHRSCRSREDKREDRAPVSDRRERRASGFGSGRPSAAASDEDDGQRRLPGKLDAAHAGRAPIERSTSAAGDADDHDQQRRHDRAGDQRRPHVDGLAVIGAGQQLGADAGDRAGRQFADDRADQARGHRHLHRGEQERHRGRHAQLPECLRRGWHCRCASGRDG